MFDPKTGRMEPTDPKTLNALWGIRDSDLPAMQKLVLTMLVLRAGATQEGWKCFPSLTTIAGDAGISRRCVSTTLNALAEIWPPVFTIESGGPECSNEYTLMYNEIANLPKRAALVKRPKRR